MDETAPPPIATISTVRESWNAKITNFFEKTAFDACVPRNEIISLSQEAKLTQALDEITKTLYSGYPVHSVEDPDEIIGVLLSKDVLKNIRKLKGRKVKDLMRPMKFVAYNEPLVNIFASFQTEKAHMAILINQYGEMDGLLTVDDILYELVGTIPDTRQNSEWFFKKQSNKLVLDGRYPLSELNENFHTDFELGEPETIGGYLSFKLGRLPDIGEKHTINGYQFITLQKNARIITKLSLEKLNGSWL